MSSDRPPLHVAISEKLKAAITAGRFPPGTQLPSEHQLIETYGVSRITVRRAIANLVQQGLVVAHRGKGVFVKPQGKIIRSLANPLVFFEEDMADQGLQTRIRNLSLERVPPPADVCAKLALPPDTPLVYCQRKLILVDERPVALDMTYIPPSLGDTHAAQFQRDLIYPTLEAHGISVEQIEVLLECVYAAHEVSQPLEVPLGAPLLVNRYVAYTTNHQPLICGETLSRGDRLIYATVLTKGRPAASDKTRRRETVTETTFRPANILL